MIQLGLPPDRKKAVISAYLDGHAINKIVMLSPSALTLDLPDLGIPVQQVAYADIIEYATYYPLMQALDSHSLLVVNECMRVQDRYDLTYNCIRNYITQTPHRLIFQALPIVSSREDVMILYDWARGERYLREPYTDERLAEIGVQGQSLPVQFRVQTMSAPDALHDEYRKQREALAAKLRASRKTPLEVLPRKLYEVGRPVRLSQCRTRPALSTRTQKGQTLGYSLAPALEEIADLPLGYSELAEYIARTRQTTFDVQATDLKADQWFAARYAAWEVEIQHAYAAAHL